MPRPNSKERQEAIDRFYQFHGNHTHEPAPIVIDEIAMLLLWRRHYKGRVDISKYGFDLEAMKLPLKKAP